MYHWHGPGVVCATEPPTNLDLSFLDRCYWIVHGSALFRCTHEQLRPETVDERANRESVTETHRSAPNLDTIRGMLSKIKGPVRFVDLKGKERPCVHSPPPLAQPQQVYEPTEAEQRAAAHAARQHQQATAPTPIVPENTPTVDETAPKPSVAATEKTTSRQSGPADDPMSTGLSDCLQPFEPEEIDADGDPIGTSQSTNDAKRAMAIRTVNTGLEAVGLPPLEKPRVHLSRRTGESSNDPVESSIPGNDDLYIDCYWSSEVPNDEILVVNKSTNTIVWSRLTENEKSLFDDAKDKALLKYINRNAWRPVKRVTSTPKKTCPIVRSQMEERNGPCACVFARFQTRRLDHQVVAQRIAHYISNWTVVYLFGFGSQAVESFCS